MTWSRMSRGPCELRCKCSLRMIQTFISIKGASKVQLGLQMISQIVILLASRAYILAPMEPKFCTGPTFMFPEVSKKFESNRITLSLSKWWLSLKVMKWSFDDDWVTLLDSNFVGSSRNIKVGTVQNLGSIAASIWALEAKRMTICEIIRGPSRVVARSSQVLTGPDLTWTWAWQHYERS